MRSHAVACSILVGCWGCGFSTPTAPIDGGLGGCAFSSQFDTCALAFAGDLTLATSTTYNTDASMFDAAGIAFAHQVLTIEDVQIDAILAQNVVINDGIVLTARGRRPLAIVASGRIFLGNGAMIDVSKGGAGALDVCSTAPREGSNGLGGGGGGGGAAYGGSGGNGSDGNNDGDHAAGGSGGGSIRRGPYGGCGGARGGAALAVPGTGGGSEGGAGGGAIFLAAGDRIVLSTGATLSAGGDGGKGGTLPDGGGGGGGSGGMILLEAPHVNAPGATLAANGGGGGEGSDTARAGRAGEPALPSTGRAPGGKNGAASGADGGAGGSRGGGSGEDVIVVQDGGGGGGGGSVGFIHIASPDMDLSPDSVSPAPE